MGGWLAIAYKEIGRNEDGWLVLRRPELGRFSIGFYGFRDVSAACDLEPVKVTGGYPDTYSVNIANLRQYLQDNVDRISCGNLLVALAQPDLPERIGLQVWDES